MSKLFKSFLLQVTQVVWKHILLFNFPGLPWESLLIQWPQIESYAAYKKEWKTNQNSVLALWIDESKVNWIVKLFSLKKDPKQKKWFIIQTCVTWIQSKKLLLRVLMRGIMEELDLARVLIKQNFGSVLVYKLNFRKIHQNSCKQWTVLVH